MRPSPVGRTELRLRCGLAAAGACTRFISCVVVGADVGVGSCLRPLEAGFWLVPFEPAVVLRVVVFAAGFEPEVLDTDLAVMPFLSWYLPFSGHSN
jgi:hypothetical protein